MILNKIISKRGSNGDNYAIPIIYEWEDVIAEELEVSICNKSLIQRLGNRLSLDLSGFSSNKNSFRFIINGKNCDEPISGKNLIPCIIDFFLKGDELTKFYKLHSKNKMILLSSPFDYEYLKENNCPLPIGLFAYSIPDLYSIEGKQFDKKYDVVLTGRQDPTLYSFFKEYVKKHPEITYVKRGRDLENDFEKTKPYYLNGKKEIGSLSSRLDYINLLSQAKVSLYGTQGIIKDNWTTGFYHVTPAFLERIACGCHVLAHYPVGTADAKYYELDKFSPSIESYEMFEEYMNKALSTPIDINKYKEYLKKHYTSTRVHELKKLLDTI